MSDKISSDVATLDPGAIVTLFEMDLSTGTAPDSTDILRWHSGTNEQLQEVVWQGNQYVPFPVQAEGFEYSGKGAIPRPTLTIANITSAISALISSYDDLVGAKVSRKRTFAKYLDSYCYVGGEAVGGTCTGESGGSPYSSNKADCLSSSKNGSAGTWTVYTSTSCETAGGTWYANSIEDDTAHFADEIWYVDRKAVETNTHIQFELSAAHDIHGIKLPSRSIIANTCVWLYKGAECGYVGSVTSSHSTTLTSSSGTWTVPASVTSVKVTMMGAGGGGAGGCDYGCGGGGSGGYYSNKSLSVTPGDVISYSIGSGGSGGSAGGNTTFGSLTTTGGASHSGQSTASNAGGTPGGNAGQSGNRGECGSSGDGGDGGDSPIAGLGTGGAGCCGGGPGASGPSGGNATGYGAGGGGGCNNASGGSGSGGYLKLDWSETGTGKYWDINNNSVASSANDVCAKTFTACELRFPEPNESPFGGFPGAGINMGSVR